MVHNVRVHGSYSMSTTFVFVATKHLTIVTQKWVWYIDINFYSIKPFSTTVGKLGDLNVRTNVLVDFIKQSRRTVFLRTSVTPSAQGWTAKIPFDVFGDEWVLRSILDYKMFSSLSRLFSCDSLGHCIKRSPYLGVFMLFFCLVSFIFYNPITEGYPAKHTVQTNMSTLKQYSH